MKLYLENGDPSEVYDGEDEEVSEHRFIDICCENTLLYWIGNTSSNIDKFGLSRECGNSVEILCSTILGYALILYE